MIRYSLICSRNHEFEGWFGSSDDFDRQQEGGLLECPICGSDEISKVLMAPAVATSRRRKKASPAGPEKAESQGAGMQLAGMSAEQRAIVSKMRELKERLLSTAENVGERFSEEARKIHYGETEKRGIYGKASLEEASELAEEGIDFLPLPELPDEQN